MKRMWSKNELNSKINEQLASGNVQSAKIFEGIKDSQGHDRFAEGEVTLSATSPEGVTLSYGKWSLSGSHLLVVLAVNIANTTSILDNVTFGALTLPKWIYDKLVGVAQYTLAYASFSAYASDYTTQAFGVRIQKISENKLAITKNGDLTLTKDRGVRINFDFLIDND